jgi:cysteine desulfurase
LRRLDGVHLNGEAAPRLPEILNVSFEGVEGESLVTALPMLAVTTGSACSSASGEPSYVLRALGRSTQLAQSSLRFSLGRGTTEQDVDAAAHAVITQVERLRSVSPANASGTTRQVADSAGSFVYESDTLSPLARRYFDTLPGAVAMTPGDDAGTEGTDEVVRGEAGSIGEGTWVRFHLRVANGIVKAALFQAYGCPHTLAVAAWLTGQLPGRAIAQGVEQGVPGTPAAWLEALEVPVEKLGRLLRVEDALKASFQTPV